VLGGLRAANSYFENSVTKAGLGTFYRNKAMSGTASVTGAGAAPSPATTPPVRTPPNLTQPALEDRERKDLLWWMRIIFVMLLVLTISFLALVVLMFENFFHPAISY